MTGTDFVSRVFLLRAAKLPRAAYLTSGAALVPAPFVASDPKVVGFHRHNNSRAIRVCRSGADLQDNHWIFEVVRSCRWDLTYGNFEDGSAYWLHVGPLCYSFGFKGVMPVEPLRFRLALGAVRTWLANEMSRLLGRG